MTTLLTVTGNPSSYVDGTWPEAAMNGGVWRFTFTPSASLASATYSGFHPLFVGPVVGAVTGGLWIVSGALELYDTSDAQVFSRPMTGDAGQPLTFTIDVPNRTITIAGATTGNGTTSFSVGPPYLFAGTTLTAGGVTGDPSWSIAGTIGNIDDGSAGASIVAEVGAVAITGTDATLRAAAILVADAGALAISGGAAELVAGTSGASIVADAGAVAISGIDATLRAASLLGADAGSLAISGGDATFVDGTMPVAIGDHAVDFQRYPLSDRDALITLDTQASGSVVILAAGGNSADVGQAWTDSNANAIRKLAAVQDYPDFPGYGTQVGVTSQPMTGGAAHAFTIQVANADESTAFACEVIGGRRVTHVAGNEGNTGADTTQAIGPIATDGPAVLLAFWFGSSPVNPPFVDGLGAPFTAVPDGGFAVLDSYLVNNEFGEVQAAMAGRTVATAGSYSVTWTHSPAQGAQLWLVAVEPAAVITADPGAIAISGGAANIATSGSATIVADPGSLSVAGSDATIAAGAAITAEPGALAVTGGAAELVMAWVVTAGPGAVAITGGDASLLVGATLAADAGALTITGGDATMPSSWVLTAAAGSVAIVGGDAAITGSGGPTGNHVRIAGVSPDPEVLHDPLPVQELYGGS